MTRHLGEYEIAEEIGRGGFVTVYRAREPGLDREVVVIAPPDGASRTIPLCAGGRGHEALREPTNGPTSDSGKTGGLELGPRSTRPSGTRDAVAGVCGHEL